MLNRNRLVKNIYKTALFVLTLFVISCRSDEDKVDVPYIDVITIDQSSSTFIQDATGFMELVGIVEVPRSVANAQAASLNGFNYVDDRLYAHSTYLNSLSSFDENGGVNWTIKGGSSPIETFRTADVIKYDHYGNEFLVYDGIERKIFAYDREGEFIRKELCDVNFMDFEVLEGSRVIYDASLLPNTHLQNLDQEFDLYIKDQNGNIEMLKPRPPLEKGLIPFTDNSNFIHVEGNVYYKPNFGDTTFVVREDEIAPYMMTRFLSNNRAQSILDETKTGSIARKIFDEYVPYTNIVAPARHVSCITYTSGGSRFMYAKKRSEAASGLLNSQFLKFDETIVPVPISFSNGYFFSVAKEDNRNAILEAVKDETLSNEEIERKYKALAEKARDTEGLYVYVLKPK